MARENRVLDVTFPAGEDMSAYQYHIVILTTTGTVRLPDHATTDSEEAIGVLQNTPNAAGAAAVVRVIGVSKVVLGDTCVPGTYAKLEYQSATDTGKAIPAATFIFAIGRFIEGGAEDDLGSILVTGAAYQVGAS